MNWYKNIVMSFLVYCSLLTMALGNTPEYKLVIGEPSELIKETYIEKVKKYTHVIPLNSEDDIEVVNYFGDVKFKFWDEAKVQFNIKIVANATTTERAENFLNAVDFEIGKTGKTAYCKTKMTCSKIKSKDHVADISSSDENYLKVDYIVYLPKGHALHINNAHGDVFIPDYDAPLSLVQKHGVLYANHLSNATNNIEICYGKAYIKQVDGGVLKANQTKLNITKASNIAFHNKMGHLELQEAENVDFNGKYTSGYVGVLKQSCKFQIDYSDDFAIGLVDSQVKDFQLVTSYADVEVPLCRKSKFNMTVDAKNTNMVVLHNEVAKDLDCKNKKVINKTISVGTIDQEASKILISSNHGSVKIK